MKEDMRAFYGQVNLTRYVGQPGGHYESFFQRANHPERPLAFWIRYTIFSPAGRPEDAMGELWAVFFNGETNLHTAVKQEFPFRECQFDHAGFAVRVGKALLAANTLSGDVRKGASTISWELSFDGESDPLLLLPLKLYHTKLPAAKSLVGLPLARYNGSLEVNGEKVAVENWVGSQNHNWGSRHTDLYAWGQVAGFDAYPESFLELATARIKVGPLWTPTITPIVLRHEGREYALNGLLQGVRARGEFRYFTWSFRSETPFVEIEGTMSAPGEAFVGLNYYNPPGGSKHCLNTKIASCTVRLRDIRKGTSETLQTNHRAAFEILTDDRSHGITIAA
jgi:hypothetical protein